MNVMFSVVKVCSRLSTNGINNSLSAQLSIKQEMKFSDPLLLTKKDKKPGRDLSECHKKKKRKQRSPAKVYKMIVFLKK